MVRVVDVHGSGVYVCVCVGDVRPGRGDTWSARHAAGHALGFRGANPNLNAKP